jgi:hypothetical protein
MDDEDILGKIKKGAEKTGDTIDKGVKKGWAEVKEHGKGVIDNPGDAFEDGMKKGWDSIKDFSKDVKDNVTKMVKKEKKK